MKKVRFNERVTMLHVTVVEQTRDSHFESNFYHECHKEEDIAAIKIVFSNEQRNSRKEMVPTLKKMRFDERATMLHVTAVEQTRDSHFESNFYHECNKEEGTAAIKTVLSNELPYYLSVLPIVKTAFNNFSNVSNAIAGSKYHCHCHSRWMMSNNDTNDVPPILPLRQNEEPTNTIISTALSIVDRPYNVTRARAA